MLKRTTEFIRDEFLCNGHLQSLGAVGIVYLSSVLVLNEHADIRMLLLTYCTFQFIYLQDRYRDVAHDELSNIKRTKHLRKFLYTIPAVLFSYLLMIILLNIYTQKYLSLTFSVILVFMGYVYTAHAKNWTRKVSLFKNIYVSSVFSLLTTFPLIYGILRFEKGTLLFSFSLLVLVESLLSQIALDFKDVNTDRKSRLLTLPVMFGNKRAKELLRLASIASALLFLVIFTYYQFSGIFSVLIIIGLLINLTTLTLVGTSNYRASVLTSSKFFVWLLVVVAIKMVI